MLQPSHSVVPVWIGRSSDACRPHSLLLVGKPGGRSERGLRDLGAVDALFPFRSAPQACRRGRDL